MSKHRQIGRFENTKPIILCYKLGYFRFNADICKKIKQIKFSQAKVVKKLRRYHALRSLRSSCKQEAKAERSH